MLCFVAVAAAAVGQSRGRGLLKFSTGSSSPSGLNTRPPGQWVSEQWSPPAVTTSPSTVNAVGLTSMNTKAGSQGGRSFSDSSPPVPSHSTPTLSLHSKATAAQHVSGMAAASDLSPSALATRSATKRSEMHPSSINGNIPLMTSASDPLPVQPHSSRVDPVFRSPSPSLCLAKAARASPHHVNIQAAQTNSPVASPSPRAQSMSPFLLTSPVAFGSWPMSSASAVESPRIAAAAADTSGAQSMLSPLAALFVPQSCSADNSLVSARFVNVFHRFILPQLEPI